MIFILHKDHVGRPNTEQESHAEIRLRYADQPEPFENCTCGKNKKYIYCCGKSAQNKHKEIVVKFISPVDSKNHHLALTPEGIFVYSDGMLAPILSSEIITTYPRKKGIKILNKISIPGVPPLITPDNIFSYFNVVLAIDTNTDTINKVSVCAISSVYPDASKGHSTFKIDPQKGMSVGRISGNVLLESIFVFKSREENNENAAWHLLFELIRQYSQFEVKTRIAVVVDSDFSNLEKYNFKQLKYFDGFLLPNGISLIYASADTKNNCLLNYSISFCDRNASLAYQEKKTEIIKQIDGMQERSNSIGAQCLFLNPKTKIFPKALPKIK